jgi:hypothetical protein
MDGNSLKSSPMLKAAGLWAKSSVKGGQYLTGRLGGVKVLIMENRDRQSDDDPSHILFFAEAPDRRGEQRVPQTHQTHQTASQPHRSGAQGYGHRAPDHQAPLTHDGPQPARDVLDDTPEWAR